MPNYVRTYVRMIGTEYKSLRPYLWLQWEYYEVDVCLLLILSSPIVEDGMGDEILWAHVMILCYEMKCN